MCCGKLGESSEKPYSHFSGGAMKLGSSYTKPSPWVTDTPGGKFLLLLVLRVYLTAFFWGWRQLRVSFSRFSLLDSVSKYTRGNVKDWHRVPRVYRSLQGKLQERQPGNEARTRFWRLVYVVELLLHGGSNAEKLQVGGVSLQNPNLWLSAVAHRSNSNTQGAEAGGSL